MKNKNISIIGLGHVGLPMATILSSLKKNGKKLYDINVIEKDDNKGNYLKKKIRSKNFELKTNDNKFNQLVKKVFRGNIEIETDFRNIHKSDIIIISVNFDIKKKERNPFSTTYNGGHFTFLRRVINYCRKEKGSFLKTFVEFYHWQNNYK